MTKKPSSARDVAADAMNLVAKLAMTRRDVTGVPSGLAELDRRTLGFHRGEVAVLAGPNSSDNTALALSFVEAAMWARHHAPVATLMFSFAMSGSHVAFRLLCSRAGISVSRFADPAPLLTADEQERFVLAADVLSSAELFIDDAWSFSFTDLRAVARSLHARQRLGFVVVDSLQQLTATSGRSAGHSRLARLLRALALELDVPILLTSCVGEVCAPAIGALTRPRSPEFTAVENGADLLLLLERPGSTVTPSAPGRVFVSGPRFGPACEIALTLGDEGPDPNGSTTDYTDRHG